MHELLLAKMRSLPVFPMISDRIAPRDDLRLELSSAVEASADYRFLNEIRWFEPVPDYATMLKELKAALGLEKGAAKRKKIWNFPVLLQLHLT